MLLRGLNNTSTLSCTNSTLVRMDAWIKTLSTDNFEMLTANFRFQTLKMAECTTITAKFPNRHWIHKKVKKLVALNDEEYLAIPQYGTIGFWKYNKRTNQWTNVLSKEDLEQANELLIWDLSVDAKRAPLRTQESASRTISEIYESSFDLDGRKISRFQTADQQSETYQPFRSQTEDEMKIENNRTVVSSGFQQLAMLPDYARGFESDGTKVMILNRDEYVAIPSSNDYHVWKYNQRMDEWTDEIGKMGMKGDLLLDLKEDPVNPLTGFLYHSETFGNVDICKVIKKRRNIDLTPDNIKASLVMRNMIHIVAEWDVLGFGWPSLGYVVVDKAGHFVIDVNPLPPPMIECKWIQYSDATNSFLLFGRGREPHDGEYEWGLYQDQLATNQGNVWHFPSSQYSDSGVLNGNVVEIVCADGGRYCIMFARAAGMIESADRPDQILVYDLQLHRWSKSRLECPLTGKYQALVMEERQSELLISGLMRQKVGTGELTNSTLPCALNQFIAELCPKEFIHLIKLEGKAKDHHWRVSINDILQNADNEYQPCNTGTRKPQRRISDPYHG